MLSKLLAGSAIRELNEKPDPKYADSIDFYKSFDKNIQNMLLLGGNLDLYLAQARIALMFFFLENDEEKYAKLIEQSYKEAFRNYSNSRKISEELEYYFYFLRDLPEFVNRKQVQEKRQKLAPVILLLEKLRKES
jgi:hypothetical protein